MIYKNFQPKLVYPFLLAVIFSGYLIVKLAITPHMKEMSNLMKRFLTLLFTTLLLTAPHPLRSRHHAGAALRRRGDVSEGNETVSMTTAPSPHNETHRKTAPQIEALFLRRCFYIEIIFGRTYASRKFHDLCALGAHTPVTRHHWCVGN